jgi:phenylalanyl-tRNA synthetase alpha chain
MEDKICTIRQSFETDLKLAKAGSNNGVWDKLYLKYFSKTTGLIALLLKEIKDLSVEDKKVFGPKLNTLQTELKEAIEQGRIVGSQAKINDPLMDLSFPLPPVKHGNVHPINQVIREMNEFFRYYGFSVAEGPEIENEEYNFHRLNLPEGHPATDLQDTLYINQIAGTLLRTHTSSIEARILEKHTFPIRVVMPGKVFRNETQSVTNLSFFYQYQGLVVDKGITIQHLKSILELFHNFLFGKDIVLRFRYKYYPEVSPGMGVDIQCKFCKGVGCTVCKFRGYVEVLGSGMIHYNTLKMSGIDPEIYTGFAFGMGLDRLVMQKYGITDIREFYQGGLIYK